MTCAPRRLARALGGVVWPVGLLLIGAAGLLELPPLTATGFAVVVVGVALFLPCNRHPDHAPYTVQPPVRGRWIAVKSPAQKLPSHGTHELARASAIDLVHVPDPSVARRRVRWWPPARPACRYPAYGQPVLAPGDGIVVAATGWQRDHWSRDTPWTLAYLLVELLVRAVLSPFGGRFVLGNRVIVDLGDGWPLAVIPATPPNRVSTFSSWTTAGRRFPLGCRSSSTTSWSTTSRLSGCLPTGNLSSCPHRPPSSRTRPTAPPRPLVRPGRSGYCGWVARRSSHPSRRSARVDRLPHRNRLRHG
jgi:hypothetical protein